MHAETSKVDPVGACVGHRGARVQAVVNELYDEKIDIVRWSADNGSSWPNRSRPPRPSKVTVNEDKKSRFVVVPDNQLSLAIGKAGQNVRLAARLTGWRIDIRSESQVARAVFEKVEEEVAAPPKAAKPTPVAVAEKAPAETAEEDSTDFVSYAEDITITADMLRDFDEDE